MGCPSSTAGHTPTGSPRLSAQGRSLEPQSSYKISQRKEKHVKNRDTVRETPPSRNLEPNPNSPANRLYTGTSEAEESAVLYKALDSRPGRRRQRLSTDTLVYQLIINITAELNQFGTTDASSTGCDRTIPPFGDGMCLPEREILQC